MDSIKVFLSSRRNLISQQEIVCQEDHERTFRDDIQFVLLEVFSTSKNRAFVKIPLTEDPASEGSAVLGPGTFLHSCKACKAMSLTGFNY